MARRGNRRTPRELISADVIAAEVLQDAQRRAAERILGEYEYGAQYAESPIERLMLAQFLHPDLASEFDTRVDVVRPKSGLIGHVSPPPIPAIFVYPQIVIGEYRVDFLLFSTLFGDRQSLVVECDGHDFHERTKEQAKRDKARDRYLVSQGYRLARFTGSEIYNDPFSAAYEAFSMLISLS